MTRKTHGGKGDMRRKGADDKAYAKNWERIFGNSSKARRDDYPDMGELFREATRK